MYMYVYTRTYILFIEVHEITFWFLKFVYFPRGQAIPWGIKTQRAHSYADERDYKKSKNNEVC